MRCRECRFWSERLAQSIGGGPIEAYCLSQHGPYRGMYTTGAQGCEAGKPNTYGAIDSPGEEEELAQMYADDDAAVAKLAEALAGAINESLATERG